MGVVWFIGSDNTLFENKEDIIMKVIVLENEGVIRKVSVTDSDAINHWVDRGYTPVTNNGEIVFEETSAQNTVGHITDAKIRDAILKASAVKTK